MQDPPAGAPTGAHEFNNFEQVTDPKFYAPLPDDYVLGLTDVVGSTKAIAAGRYKAVNMAGADRKSTRLNSSHLRLSRMPSSA